MDDLGPTLPAALYHEPAAYQRERTAVFGRTWWVIGLSAEVTAGQALGRSTAGTPVVVVRRDDGVLAAFHNVCRHRAGPLVLDDQPEACSGVLRCRYHGWTYGLDGRLQRTPDFGADLDPEAWALHPVAVAEHRGVVFVHLDARRTADDLRAFLGPFAEVMPDLSGYRPVSTARHALRCNWKTYVENYLEGYHIPYVHPDLRRQVRMADYAVEPCGPAVLHRVPMRGPPSAFDGTWAWLWPNVALNVYGGACSLERMVPTGPGTMHIDYTYAAASDAPDRAALDGQAESAAVTDEDIAICEAVQRNLEAGVYDTGRLSPRHEAGVRLFQDLLRRALGLA